MLIINYNSRQGRAYSDSEVEAVIIHALSQSVGASSSRRRSTSSTSENVNVEIPTCTENIVLMTRTLMAEGVMNSNQVRILWNGSEMYLDNAGRIINWSNSFSGNVENCIDRMIHAQSRRGR